MITRLFANICHSIPFYTWTWFRNLGSYFNTLSITAYDLEQDDVQAPSSLDWSQILPLKTFIFVCQTSIFSVSNPLLRSSLRHQAAEDTFDRNWWPNYLISQQNLCLLVLTKRCLVGWKETPLMQSPCKLSLTQLGSKVGSFPPWLSIKSSFKLQNLTLPSVEPEAT